jgi:hypothetical protein
MRDDMRHLNKAPPRLSDLRGDELARTLRQRHENNRAAWLRQHEPRRGGLLGVIRTLFGGKAHG